MTMNGYTIGKPEEEGFLSSSEGRNWDWGWGAPRVDPRSGSFPYEVAARASPPHSASLPCDLLKDGIRCTLTTKKDDNRKKIEKYQAVIEEAKKNIRLLEIEEAQCNKAEQQLQGITGSDALFKFCENLRQQGICEFNCGPLQVNPEEIQISELLGSGFFGTVWSGYCRGSSCAVKIIPVKENDFDHLATIWKEISVLGNCHDHIIGLMGYSITSQEIRLVMPLKKENLRTYLQRENLSEFRRIEIFQEICDAVRWLHKRKHPILHLDLKLENILVDERGEVFLSDFGFSATMKGTEISTKNKRTIGNLSHSAPEVVVEQKINEKFDIFGLGILLWEILNGVSWCDQAALIIGLSDPRELQESFLNAVQKGFRPHPVDEEYSQILQLLWEQNPQDRPDIDSVCTGLYAHLKKMCMQKQLRSVLNDQNARSFWYENFWNFGETPINFMKCFMPAFLERMRCPGISDLDEKFLRFVFRAGEIGDGFITLPQFASVVNGFGFGSEHRDSISYLTYMKTICNLACFRPDLERAQANTLLSAQTIPVGFYIVRFSSKLKPNCPFTLSIKQMHQKVTQLRIKSWLEGDNERRVYYPEEPKDMLYDPRMKSKSIVELLQNESFRERYSLLALDSVCVDLLPSKLLVDFDCGYFPNGQ